MIRSTSHPLGVFPAIFLLSLLIFTGCAEDSEVNTLSASVYNSLYANEANTDFDDGSANGWSMGGLWHISSVRSDSPSKSAWYGDETTGDYDTGAANSGSMQRSVDLTNVSTMDFDYYLDTEYLYLGGVTWDYFSVDISTDSGASWTTLADPSTTPSLLDTNDGSGTFFAVSLDISAYTGQSVEIRFFFNTVDGGNNAFEGAFVDNIVFQ